MHKFKRLKAENTAVTRRIRDFDGKSGNIYETLAILSKRANQISREIKEQLDAEIAPFSAPADTLDEVYENKDQIEIARRYEQMPKPTLLSIAEYLKDQIYWRNPNS
jgi:DNA-directed RNA polymerase subunit K/omega